MKIVDVHSHITPKGFLERAPRDNGHAGFSVRPTEGFGGNYELVFRGTGVGSLAEEHAYPVLKSEYDVEERLHGMKSQGIDVQVLTVSPMLFNYGAEVDDAVSHCAQLNDELAAIALAQPSSFVSLGMVPAQDTEASVKELTRAVTELGMPGIQLGANIWGEDLDSPRLRPLLQAADEYGAIIFVHPAVSQSPPDAVANMTRLGDYYLRNLIGSPLDTTISIARIIFSGLLDELRNLRFVFAHAGGFAPLGVGRLDHGFRVRPEASKLSEPPSQALKRVYLDSITHLPAGLRLMVELLGEQQIVLGSDYPYDMGPVDPVGDVRSAGLSVEAEEVILSTNALQLFGINSE